jgi:hypothetical protein
MVLYSIFEKDNEITGLEKTCNLTSKSFSINTNNRKLIFDDENNHPFLPKIKMIGYKNKE